METERRRQEEEQRAEEERQRREREKQEELRRQEEEWQRRKASEVTEDLPSGPPSYSSVATPHLKNFDETIADVDMSTPFAKRHLELLRRVETLEQR